MIILFMLAVILISLIVVSSFILIPKLIDKIKNKTEVVVKTRKDYHREDIADWNLRFEALEIVVGLREPRKPTHWLGGRGLLDAQRSRSTDKDTWAELADAYSEGAKLSWGPQVVKANKITTFGTPVSNKIRSGKQQGIQASPTESLYGSNYVYIKGRPYYLQKDTIGGGTIISCVKNPKVFIKVDPFRLEYIDSYENLEEDLAYELALAQSMYELNEELA